MFFAYHATKQKNIYTHQKNEGDYTSTCNSKGNMSANVSIEGVAFVRTDSPSMVVNQKVSAGIPESFPDVAWGGCFFFSSLIFVAKISVKRGPDIPDPSIPGCSYLERPTKLLSFKVQHVPSEGSVLKFVPKMASMIAIPLKGTT